MYAKLLCDRLIPAKNGSDHQHILPQYFSEIARTAKGRLQFLPKKGPVVADRALEVLGEDA